MRCSCNTSINTLGQGFGPAHFFWKGLGMKETFSAYLMLHKGVVVKVIPSGGTREQAQKQLDDAYSHFRRFAGGTQSVKAWVEMD